jgi:hypothetical protein
MGVLVINADQMDDIVKVLDNQKGLNFECKWFLCQKLKGNIPL